MKPPPNIERLSRDLKEEMPLVEGPSVTNLRYCRRFYLLYSKALDIHPQLEGELSVSNSSPQLEDIFKIPWGHHKLILDKVKGETDKALSC